MAFLEIYDYGNWGTGVDDGENGDKYLGIGYKLTDHGNCVTVVADVLYWDGTANMTDSINEFYFDIDKNPSQLQSRGALDVKITTTQTVIASFNLGSFAKTKTSTSHYCIALWENIGTNGITVNVTSTFTIPALSQYTITFDVNGGTPTISDIKKWYDEGVSIPETIPSLNGHIFVGWSTSLNKKPNYFIGDYYIENKNATLYAVWIEENYDIYVNNEYCEANEFIEIDHVEMNQYGQVYANEFIESSDGTYIGNQMQFNCLIEKIGKLSQYE